MFDVIKDLESLALDYRKKAAEITKKEDLAMRYYYEGKAEATEYAIELIKKNS